ncbi:hypothetical protein T484DRAFT_1903136, partial [Baffinella frigidus]
MSGQGYQGSEQIWEHPREVVGSPAPMAPPKNGVSGGVPSAAMGDWQGQVEAPVGGVPGVAFSVPQMPGMQQVQVEHATEVNMAGGTWDDKGGNKGKAKMGRPKGAKDTKPRTRRSKQTLAALREIQGDDQGQGDLDPLGQARQSMSLKERARLGNDARVANERGGVPQAGVIGGVIGEGGVPKTPGRPKGAKDAKPRTRRSKQEIAEQRTTEGMGMPGQGKAVGMAVGYPGGGLHPGAFDQRIGGWTGDPRGNPMGAGHMPPQASPFPNRLIVEMGSARIQGQAWEGPGYPPGMQPHPHMAAMGGFPHPGHPGHPHLWPGQWQHPQWGPHAHGGHHLGMVPGMQGDGMPWGHIPGGMPGPPGMPQEGQPQKRPRAG